MKAGTRSRAGMASARCCGCSTHGTIAVARNWRLHQACSKAHLPGRRRQYYALAMLGPVSDIAAADPSMLQDVIVGGAVTAAVAAALVSGLRKEPEPCPLCQGTGGAKCFGCGGAGEMGALIDPLQASAARPARRDVVGRSGGNPRACRVCSGAGLVLCRECRGSGFVTKV